MFGIRFYNDFGTVCFGGGTSAGRWRVTECDGLAVADKSFTVCRYVCEDGQNTLSARKNARTVTLSGDFYVKDGGAEEYRAAMKVFSEKGILEADIGTQKRRTEAYCSVFDERGREGAYKLFTVQFICDSPYFESAEAYETPIYKTVPYLNADFKFPGMFSTRVSRRNVVNVGDVLSEPTVYINAGHNPSGELTVKNHTSGSGISLNYEPAADETVVIDAARRRIYGADGKNLLGCLSDDSFFDGFVLLPGENDVEVIIGEENRELSADCLFRPRYSEAVYIC